MTDDEAEFKLGIRVFSTATTKTCTRCNKAKVLSKFAKNKRCLLGCVSICKVCKRKKHNIDPTFTSVLSMAWV